MDALTRRIAAALLLLAATVAARTNASNWNTVKAFAAGTDVRIVNGSRTFNGKIEGVTDETIVANSGKGQETFKQQDVLRVSLKKNGHRTRNALIGLGVGAGVGVGVGAAADANCTGLCFGGNFAKAIFTPPGSGCWSSGRGVNSDWRLARNLQKIVAPRAGDRAAGRRSGAHRIPYPGRSRA